MSASVRIATLFLACISAAPWNSPALAGEPVKGKNNPVTFDGVLWAKYAYLLEDISPDDSKNDLNGFAIDRVYLTFTSRLAERYAGRVRIEMSNQNDGSIKTFLKAADVTVQDPFGLEGAKLRFGQTEGLISGWLQEPWGYRIVAKTVPDRYLGLGTTYLGAGFLGKWLAGMLETDLLVANRSAYGDSVSGGGADAKYKSFGARAYVRPFREGPAKGFGTGGYVQLTPKKSPWNDNRDLWVGVHAFFERPGMVVGAQYDVRKQRVSRQGEPASEKTAAVISALARYMATSRIEVFVRGDVVDFDTDGGRYEVLDSVIQGKPAETNLMAGVSRAYSDHLRSVVDLSFRRVTDDLYMITTSGETGVSPDDEVVLTVRLDAAL